MSKWFKREQTARSFVLSGFDTRSAYELREACWEPDDEFQDVESASAAALARLAKQAPEAQVEVIEVSGQEGKVKRVVTQSGVEDVQ